MQFNAFQHRLNSLASMLSEVAAGTWRATQAMGAALGQPAAFVMTAQDPTSGQGWIAKAPPESGRNFSLCVIGHACLDDRFEDLILTRSGPVYHDNTGTAEPVYGWEAVKAYFGLDDEAAKKLFHPGTYDDPSIHTVMMRLGFHIYESRQHEAKLTGR